MTDPFRCAQRIEMQGLRVGCSCCRPRFTKKQGRKIARARMKRTVREEVES